ncbi:arylsulfatase A-like enzyme [Arenibacter algicola]|uniref:Arylsulfatase A-like enzyme n=1 Tax=Arenibacter algicola TaxID=616991 RepID=A0ABY3AGQ4_9FLAO
MKSKKAILLWSVFIGSWILSQVGLAQEKPNILWITIEDTSPQFIGCYGNEDASTPVIDQLAQEGVRFTNAFSTGTVCSPSRSTIITGVRTFEMGTGHHRSNYAIPSFIHGFPYYMKKEGYYVTNNSKTDYNVGNIKDFTNEAWNESSDKAGWWNRKPGQPFFAVFNFNDSHQSRTMSMSYDWYAENVWNHLSEEDRILDNAFEMPPFYNDTPEMRKQFARVYNSIKLTDNRIGNLLQKLEKDNLRDDTIIFFYADHGEGMPRGKTNGINYGYRVPFVVWFPEKYKHLSPWGTSGAVAEELISFEDLAPTLISLTGGNVPEYLNGRILMGKDRSEAIDHLVLSSDRADNGPDMVRSITDGRFVYSRNFVPFTPQVRHIRYINIGEITQHMRDDLAKDKLNPLQKSVFSARPSEFLYDIKNDIWETNNLVDDPRYTAYLKKMRKQLDLEILEAKDVHFLPEYEIGLISKKGTAYEYRTNTGNYPIKKIYAAASLSGKLGYQIAKRQIALLKSKNSIVRYWAITGLRCQSEIVLKPYKNQLLAAIEDTYPPVAITASAISFDHFKQEKAAEKLREFCLHNNMDLALMAINGLLYIDEKQPFVQTILKVHNLPNRNYNVKAACMDFLGILNLVPNTAENEH